MNSIAKERFADRVTERLTEFDDAQKKYVKSAIIEEMQHYVVYTPEEAYTADPERRTDYSVKHWKRGSCRRRSSASFSARLLYSAFGSRNADSGCRTNSRPFKCEHDYGV